MSGGADESGGMGACGGGPARCVPGTVTLENGEEKMREAGEQIQRGGSLVMDMSASGDCDSAALGGDDRMAPHGGRAQVPPEL